MDWNVEMDLDQEAEAPTRSQIQKARENLTCQRCGAHTVPSPTLDDPERRVCAYLSIYGFHRDKAE